MLFKVVVERLYVMVPAEEPDYLRLVDSYLPEPDWWSPTLWGGTWKGENWGDSGWKQVMGIVEHLQSLCSSLSADPVTHLSSLCGFVSEVPWPCSLWDPVSLQSLSKVSYL